MRSTSSDKPKLNDEEQRVFDLLGEGLPMHKVIERLGGSKAEAAALVYRVVTLRGTPNSEAIKEGIERLEKINFV